MSNGAIKAFVKEHGTDCVKRGNYWIFADGAALEDNQWGAMIPPFLEGQPNVNSMDVKKTLQRKLFYAQTKLGKAIKMFEASKKELEQRASDAYMHCSVSPDESEIDDLHRLQAEVKVWQGKVEEIELELNPPRAVSEPYFDLEKREKAKEYLDKVKAVEV